MASLPPKEEGIDVSVVDESWYVRPSGSTERVGAGGAVLRVEAGQIVLALVKEVELGDSGFVIPKGGVESGESLEEAAQREIREETGLTDLTRVCDLGVLARMNFKKSYWQMSHYGVYLTNQAGGQIPDPANYGLEWFGLGQLPQMIWPDERQLLERNEDLIIRELQRASNS